jgi:hypothetical protein
VQMTKCSSLPPNEQGRGGEPNACCPTTSAFLKAGVCAWKHETTSRLQEHFECFSRTLSDPSLEEEAIGYMVVDIMCACTYKVYLQYSDVALSWRLWRLGGVC